MSRPAVSVRASARDAAAQVVGIRASAIRAVAFGAADQMASSTESSKPPVVPLIIAGRGGHGQVVRDIAEATGRFAVIAVVDDAFQASELQNDGVWHCSVDFVPELLRAHPDGQVIIAIGSNHVRRQFVGRLALPEARYALLIHPGAHISHRAAVTPGTVVMPGAVVNAGARIGAHAIINSGAVVEHDAIVGAYAHLSPRAAIAGAAIVGEGAQLGIGSSVIPSIEIGEWSVLGAGAAAVKDIPARVLAVGVPAKVRRELD